MPGRQKTDSYLPSDPDGPLRQLPPRAERTDRTLLEAEHREETRAKFRWLISLILARKRASMERL
ncbi:atrazine chlorohydrolase guanine deaminase [Moniliophthora roreri]|nr:atrazine chlorohydrolase guanine deaminase [Moniliophthora roreri]